MMNEMIVHGSKISYSSLIRLRFRPNNLVETTRKRLNFHSNKEFPETVHTEITNAWIILSFRTFFFAALFILNLNYNSRIFLRLFPLSSGGGLNILAQLIFFDLFFLLMFKLVEQTFFNNLSTLKCCGNNGNNLSWTAIELNHRKRTWVNFIMWNFQYFSMSFWYIAEETWARTNWCTWNKISRTCNTPRWRRRSFSTECE